MNSISLWNVCSFSSFSLFHRLFFVRLLSHLFEVERVSPKLILGIECSTTGVQSTQIGKSGIWISKWHMKDDRKSRLLCNCYQVFFFFLKKKRDDIKRVTFSSLWLFQSFTPFRSQKKNSNRKIFSFFWFIYWDTNKPHMMWRPFFSLYYHPSQEPENMFLTLCDVLRASHRSNDDTSQRNKFIMEICAQHRRKISIDIFSIVCLHSIK